MKKVLNKSLIAALTMVVFLNIIGGYILTVYQCPLDKSAPKNIDYIDFLTDKNSVDGLVYLNITGYLDDNDNFELNNIMDSQKLKKLSPMQTYIKLLAFNEGNYIITAKYSYETANGNHSLYSGHTAHFYEKFSKLYLIIVDNNSEGFQYSPLSIYCVDNKEIFNKFIEYKQGNESKSLSVYPKFKADLKNLNSDGKALVYYALAFSVCSAMLLYNIFNKADKKKIAVSVGCIVLVIIIVLVAYIAEYKKTNIDPMTVDKLLELDLQKIDLTVIDRLGSENSAELIINNEEEPIYLNLHESNIDYYSKTVNKRFIVNVFEQRFYDDDTLVIVRPAKAFNVDGSVFNKQYANQIEIVNENKTLIISYWDDDADGKILVNMLSVFSVW